MSADERFDRIDAALERQARYAQEFRTEVIVRFERIDERLSLMGATLTNINSQMAINTKAMERLQIGLDAGAAAWVRARNCKRYRRHAPTVARPFLLKRLRRRCLACRIPNRDRYRPDLGSVACNRKGRLQGKGSAHLGCAEEVLMEVRCRVHRDASRR